MTPSFECDKRQGWDSWGIYYFANSNDLNYNLSQYIEQTMNWQELLENEIFIRQVLSHVKYIERSTESKISFKVILTDIISLRRWRLGGKKGEENISTPPNIWIINWFHFYLIIRKIKQTPKTGTEKVCMCKRKHTHL